ncbi:MAG: mechanosensitive ion channel domain-containing protein [Wenzhouxiangella sp.]
MFKKVAYHWQALLLATSVLMASTAQAKADIDALLEQQAQELAQVERLLEAIANQPVEYRDALLWRLDERLLALLAGLDEQLIELASVAVMPDAESDPLDEERILTARRQTERILDLSLDRVHRITDRIAQERDEVGEFDEGLRSNIAESFIQEQQLLRMRYLQTTVGSLELIERLAAAGGLDESKAELAGRLRLWLEAQALLLAERIAGQIRLDTNTLIELRSRQAEDPLDSELGRAVRVLQRKQARSINSLEATLGIMDQLGLDTAEYRVLIIRQRGMIGVELLQRQVFSRVMRDQLDNLQQALVTTGPNFVLRALVFLTILLLAWLLARLVRVVLRVLLDRGRVRITRLSGEVLLSVSGIVVFLFGLLVGLSTLGVSVGPMLAGLGVAGIILGFALQDSLSNLASGAMILLYQPYDVDDHVRVGDVEGVVKRMNLVATTIATFDNQVLVVPNKNIWGDNIVNHTASRVRRVDIQVSFSYDEDIDFVEQVLMEEMKAHDRVLSTPAPTVHISRWDDSAITMMAKPWVRTADYWPTLRGLTKRFKQRFDAENISIPFPQRDIHLYQHGEPPARPKRSRGASEPVSGKSTAPGSGADE